VKVEFLEAFEHDLDGLSDASLLKAVTSVISNIEQAKSLREVRNIKKLKGYKNIYRIRIRDYRLGFKVEKGVVQLARFLNRKDIYRLFP
jgi:mRNA interferase RelE/StbE